MMKSNRLQNIRHLIQLLSLLISIAILVVFVYGGSKVAHHFCPYAVVCFGLSGAAFIKITETIFGIAIIAGFLISILSMFWGRKFCGYICPLGTIQEAIFMLRSKKYRRTKRVPYFYENKFNKLKYLILILNAILVITGVGYLYMKLCPVLAVSRILNIGWQGYSVLILIIIGSYYIERIWCRFLCPYAALLNVFQSIGALFHIPRTKIYRCMESCIDCSICNNNCPMNINISDVEVIDDHNCIQCGICTCKCPKSDTLTFHKE